MEKNEILVALRELEEKVDSIVVLSQRFNSERKSRASRLLERIREINTNMHTMVDDSEKSMDRVSDVAIGAFRQSSDDAYNTYLNFAEEQNKIFQDIRKSLKEIIGGLDE